MAKSEGRMVMKEFWNVVIGMIVAFIAGVIVHSAYRHSFDGKSFLKRGIRKILNGLLDFELWLLGEPIPENWECVDYVYVTEKLIGAFPFAKLYLADIDYYLCPQQDVVDFLAEDPTNQERYVTEVFDCDDFSFRLMGQFHTKPYSALAFGIAWSSVHAYNVFIDKEGKVWIVEPQTDQLIEPEEGKAEYKTELIIM